MSPEPKSSTPPKNTGTSKPAAPKKKGPGIGHWIGRTFQFLFWAVFLLGCLYLALLCHPQPLFAHRFDDGRFTLYCDDPIPTQAAGVLADVQKRLSTSPLDVGRPHQNIFICDQDWRYRLLTNRYWKSGGLAYGFAPWNVFLRKSDIAQNVLFTHQGNPSGPDRPLSYFIAHEITHNLTSRLTGPVDYFFLPVWKREGYADYVGKGGDFDFEKNLQLYRAGSKALDPHASGLYLRYHLMVAELLDREGMGVEQMLGDDIDEKELEAKLLGHPAR